MGFISTNTNEIVVPKRFIERLLDFN